MGISSIRYDGINTIIDLSTAGEVSTEKESTAEGQSVSERKTKLWLIIIKKLFCKECLHVDCMNYCVWLNEHQQNEYEIYVADQSCIWKCQWFSRISCTKMSVLDSFCGCDFKSKQTVKNIHSKREWISSRYAIEEIQNSTFGSQKLSIRYLFRSILKG